jgi:hypothetical protein
MTGTSSAFGTRRLAAVALPVTLVLTAALTAGVGAGRTVRAHAAGAALAPATVSAQPGLIHRWAALNQVKHEKLTKAQITSLARNVDLVVVKNTDTRTVTLLKAANPRLVTLVYSNGAFAQKNEGTRFPEAWYARDAAGNKITMPNFGNYLMDVSNPGWADQVVATCLDYRAQSGADGCYTDMLMTSPLFKNYVSAKPINPATGQVWTFPAYQAQVDVIADRVAAATGGIDAANGVANGTRWYAQNGGSSKSLTDHVAAAHSEIWIRDRTLGVTTWPDAVSWRQDIDMVAEAEAQGRVLMIETKLWPKGGQPEASADLAAQWRDFVRASYLLGGDGQSTWLLFDVDRTFNGMLAADPADQAPIGTPTGAYSLQASGAFVRGFSTGFVAVNPGATSLVVTLPVGTWQRVGAAAGSTESGDVTLAPHTGVTWQGA